MSVIQQSLKNKDILFAIFRNCTVYELLKVIPQVSKDWQTFLETNNFFWECAIKDYLSFRLINSENQAFRNLFLRCIDAFQNVSNCKDYELLHLPNKLGRGEFTEIASTAFDDLFETENHIFSTPTATPVECLFIKENPNLLCARKIISTAKTDILDQRFSKWDEIQEKIKQDPNQIYKYEHLICTKIPKNIKIPPDLQMYLKCGGKNLLEFWDETKLYSAIKFFQKFVHPISRVPYWGWSSELWKKTVFLSNICDWIPVFRLDSRESGAIINCNVDSQYFGYVVTFLGAPFFSIKILAESWSKFILILHEYEKFSDDDDNDNDNDCFTKEEKRLKYLRDLPDVDYPMKDLTVNLGTACDICDVCPMIGKRYHCENNCNFDMCQDCFVTHAHLHPHKLAHHPSNGKRSYYKNENEN